MIVALLLAGFAALVLGAELLVRGASRLALALRIPPLVVGLSIVAFGTSSPELAVSTRAALAGQADIALGNVVGSNIFNVLFILGLAALVAPLRVASRLVRFDVPVMIGVSVLLIALVRDGMLGRVEGLALAAGLVAYLVYLFRSGGGEEVGSDEVGSDGPVAGAPDGAGSRGVRDLLVDLALIAAGLVLLVLGADWLVRSARTIATGLGVSELMIGLTLVAAGTSLPELATSVIAAARGQREIAVGNVVGSNIFNILGILGITAAIAPDGIAVGPAALSFDLPIMTAVAVACLPVFAGGVIARWEGAVFVGYYIAYIAYLALDATDHGAFPAFREAMLYFALPLTVLTLAVLMARRWPRAGAGSPPGR